MKGHSPIPADLMYEVARDRRVSRLSTEDINSVRAIYAIPNGTVYARVPRGPAAGRPAPHAPDGAPQLSQSPYVDEGLGFALYVPVGWRLVPARRGVVAIDGLAWDYEGSFQVIVHGYPTIASYVKRHGSGHVRDGQVLSQGQTEIGGYPAFQMTVAQRGGALIEDHVFIETGDGRVIVVIEEAPADLRASFTPWFDAMQASLQVLPASVPGAPMAEPKSKQARRVPPPPPAPPAAETPTAPVPTPASEAAVPQVEAATPAPQAQPQPEPSPAPKPRSRMRGPGMRR
jgi:hypothetical protein